MRQKQIWQDFSTLPPVARQQVIDFIAFLRDRYVESEQAVGQIQSSLHEEPFIGIWRDNERMSDSSSWVRELRKSEWG